MNTNEATKELFFCSVRNEDIQTVRLLLGQDPSLARERWRGRAGVETKMRSLGLSPYNRHTWVDPPAELCDLQDPCYSSTPLIYTRDDDMVRLLVQFGADVNAKGTCGDIELLEWHYTPLWRAAHDGRIASVRVLVKAGADLNFLNPDGTNQALLTAVENGSVEVAGYLLASGAVPDIFSASMLGLVDRVEGLVGDDPGCVSHQDSHGRYPLDAAILLDSFRMPWLQAAEHDRVAAILIAAGANVDLSHAASLGWEDNVLDKLGADPQLRNWKRPTAPLITGAAEFESPIEAAIRRGHSSIVSSLQTSE